MSTKMYQVWLLVMMTVFVLTLYRPIGILVFLVWSAVYAWLVTRRATATGQRREGRIAAFAGIIGGIGLQGTFLNIQLNILPWYLVPPFGILGVVGFGIAFLFSIVLIRGWYPT